MSIAGFLYLIDLVKNIDCTFGGLIIIYILLLGILGFVYAITHDDYSKEDEVPALKFIKILSKKWWVIVSMLMVSVLVPSQNTMYLMVGSSYLSQSNLPAKVSQALELKLDDVIKDLKDKNKGDE